MDKVSWKYTLLLQVWMVFDLLTLFFSFILKVICFFCLHVLYSGVGPLMHDGLAGLLVFPNFECLITCPILYMRKKLVFSFLFSRDLLERMFLTLHNYSWMKDFISPYLYCLNCRKVLPGFTRTVYCLFNNRWNFMTILSSKMKSCKVP